MSLVSRKYRFKVSGSRPESEDNVSVSVKCLQLFLLSHHRAMTRKPCQIFISDRGVDKKQRIYPHRPFPYFCVLILVITQLCGAEMRGVESGDPPQCLMFVSHNGNLLITVRNTINRIKNPV